MQCCFAVKSQLQQYVSSETAFVVVVTCIPVWLDQFCRNHRCISLSSYSCMRFMFSMAQDVSVCLGCTHPLHVDVDNMLLALEGQVSCSGEVPQDEVHNFPSAVCLCMCVSP